MEYAHITARDYLTAARPVLKSLEERAANNTRLRRIAAATLGVLVTLNGLAIEYHGADRPAAAEQIPPGCRDTGCFTADILHLRPGFKPASVAVPETMPAPRPTVPASVVTKPKPEALAKPLVTPPTTSLPVSRAVLPRMAVGASDLGVDISWPDGNCNYQLSSHQPAYGFVVVGVNHGQDFTNNACLSGEVAQARHMNVNPALYANSDFPGLDKTAQYNQQTDSTGHTPNNSPLHCDPSQQNYNLPHVTNSQECVAYDFGFHAGVAAVNYAAANGFKSGEWWIDVETGNDWAPTDQADLNAADLYGEISAVRGVAGRVGIYTTPKMWPEITNGLLDGEQLPAWLAMPSGDPNTGRNDCAQASPNWGRLHYVQYGVDTVDQDVVCPGPF